MKTWTAIARETNLTPRRVKLAHDRGLRKIRMVWKLHELLADEGVTVEECIAFLKAKRYL